MDQQRIKDILGQLLQHLGLSFTDIQVAEGDGFTRVDIESAAASQIIGWHGETLNSIQHLLKAIMRTQEKMDRSPFLVLDADGYRREQESRVCAVAEHKADFVRRTGSRVALPPMSPYFRRVVHLYVANTPELQDLMTISMGEGDYRQVVLCLKEKKVGKEGDEGELSPVIEEAGDGLENLDV